MGSNSRTFANAAKAIYDGAAMENRSLTPEEAGRFHEFLAKSEEARAAEERVGGIAASVYNDGGWLSNDPQAQPWVRGIDPGRTFVESSGYKSIKDPGSRPQQWSTGAVPVG